MIGWYSCTIQSSSFGERLHSGVHNRSWEDLCTSSLSYICSNIIGSCSCLIMETLSIEYKKCFFEWKHFWGGLYVALLGFLIFLEKVLRLWCMLCGFKWASRACFSKFSSIATNFSFIPSYYNSAFFIWSTSSGITLLLSYIDDMIITGDDVAGIHELKSYLYQ